MRIAVLGSGHIGGTIGKKWIAVGHDVTFGVRDPGGAKMQAVLADVDGRAQANTIPNALAGAEAVLFAIPGTAMAETVQANGQALDGKLLIDATNNMSHAPAYSAVDVLKKYAPGAQVYRAFNSLGWENFADPVIDGVQADLFFCGPQQARSTVERLIAEVGLRPIYVGDLDQVSTVDAILPLWFQLVGPRGMPRRTAFRVLSARS